MSVEFQSHGNENETNRTHNNNKKMWKQANKHVKTAVVTRAWVEDFQIDVVTNRGWFGANFDLSKFLFFRCWTDDTFEFASKRKLVLLDTVKVLTFY